MKDNTKPSNRGGARPGSGRKNRYGEAVTHFTVHCPASKKDELKAIIQAHLDRWKIDKKSEI